MTQQEEHYCFEQHLRDDGYIPFAKIYICINEKSLEDDIVRENGFYIQGVVPVGAEDLETATGQFVRKLVNIISKEMETRSEKEKNTLKKHLRIILGEADDHPQQ